MEAIFGVLMTMIVLSFIVIITLILAYIGVKIITRRIKEKKALEYLNLGYKVTTTNSDGVPIILERDKKYISINIGVKNEIK